MRDGNVSSRFVLVRSISPSDIKHLKVSKTKSYLPSYHSVRVPGATFR